MADFFVKVSHKNSPLWDKLCNILRKWRRSPPPELSRALVAAHSAFIYTCA